MTPPRRTPIPAALAALLVLAAGCSSATDPNAASGPAAGAPSATVPAPASSSVTTPVVPSVTPASSSACPTVGATGIPDGTWAGPLTVKVRGSAPESATRGKGTGVLQVVVHGGRVTGGTWALTWTSAGPSTAKDSQATVQLHGQVAGTVTGTGPRPVLRGRWTVTGSAAVTSPVTATATVDQVGRGHTALTARATACDAVTGGFAPSFRSTDAYGSSDGTARWTGRRTG